MQMAAAAAAATCWGWHAQLSPCFKLVGQPSFFLFDELPALFSSLFSASKARSNLPNSGCGRPHRANASANVGDEGVSGVEGSKQTTLSPHLGHLSQDILLASEYIDSNTSSTCIHLSYVCICVWIQNTCTFTHIRIYIYT